MKQRQETAGGMDRVECGRHQGFWFSKFRSFIDLRARVAVYLARDRCKRRRYGIPLHAVIIGIALLKVKPNMGAPHVVELII